MARDHLLDVCHKPTFVLLAYGYRRVSVVRGADISAARREGFKGHDFPRARQRAGTIRLVIPPEESTVIQRHYDALTMKSRSKAANALAAERTEQGIEPAFLRKAARGLSE